jgi:hypothetical protein
MKEVLSISINCFSFKRTRTPVYPKIQEHTHRRLFYGIQHPSTIQAKIILNKPRVANQCVLSKYIFQVHPWSSYKSTADKNMLLQSHSTLQVPFWGSHGGKYENLCLLGCDYPSDVKRNTILEGNLTLWKKWFIIRLHPDLSSLFKKHKPTTKRNSFL